MTSFPPLPTLRLAEIELKLGSGERLDSADGQALLATNDLLGLARLADAFRRGRAGDEVYFITNRHINHTNVCKNRCSFCAFSREAGEEGAYTMALDEVLARADASLPQGVTELHIVGGEHPSLPYAYYRDDDRAAPRAGARRPPDRVHGVRDRPLRRHQRHDRGSGAARPQVGRTGLAARRRGGDLRRPGPRRGLPQEDLGGDGWLEVHKLGPPLRSPHQRHHALRARGDARASGWTICCGCARRRTRPAAFRRSSRWPSTRRTPSLASCPGPPGWRTSRCWPLARLLLDNFAHIKAYWVMIGPQAGPDQPLLRRGRPRRHHRGGDHHPRRRFRCRPGGGPRRVGPDHQRRRPGTRRTGHPVPPTPPFRVSR